MALSRRIYPSALALLALLAAAGAASLFYLAGIDAPGGGAAHTRVPARALPWLAVAQAGYAIAIVAVLCTRRLNPPVGRRLTRALNWALLPALPGGTIVGLYGLWAEGGRS